MIASVRPQTRNWTRDEYHRAADDRSGITDYWILHRRGRCLKVWRDPGPTGEGEGGYRLQQIYNLH